MNILLIEDQGSVSYYWKDLLESHGYTVYDAPNLSRSKYYLRERQIDCLIVDLNIPPDGLTPVEIAQSLDGLLSGWIILREYAYKMDVALKKRTIIFSEYMNRLRANVPEKELEGIYLIEKGSIDPAKNMLKHLASIAKSL